MAYREDAYTAGAAVGDSYSNPDVLTFVESLIIHPTHTDGFVNVNDPCYVGDIVGVAKESAAAATDYISVKTQGIFSVPVVASDDNGTVAVDIGDRLFISSVGIVSKLESGKFFGHALNTATASASATNITVWLGRMVTDVANASANTIWVGKFGHDTSGNGSFLSPYLTVTAAMAAVTTAKNFIGLFPGTYTEAATVVWRIIDGVHIRLFGHGPVGSVTIGTASGDEVILIAPGATATETFQFSISNIVIDHEEAGLDGLHVDNTSTTNKINGYIKDLECEADSDSDYSIRITHANLTDAVRLYCRRGNIEGLIGYSANNDGDRGYFTDMRIGGGLTVGATAVATDFRFFNCEIKHGGIAGGHSSTVVQLVFCYTNESGTFALADTGDVGGSITGEVIVGS